MHNRELATARAQFESDGFYICAQPVIPDDLIQRAIAGMDAVRFGHYETGLPPHKCYWKPGDDPQKLGKIDVPQGSNRAIMDLFTHPAIAELAAAITGAKCIQAWWGQLLYKPPLARNTEGGQNIGWHQDAQYWKDWEAGSELFTAWVALSNITPDAGPMKLVRGSNKWGLLDQGFFYEQDLEALRGGIAIPPGQTWEEVEVILPPGGVSFHHNLTYHGSGPNRSAEPRRSFAIHMRTEKSSPATRSKEGHMAYIDNPAYCPTIYRREQKPGPSVP